LRCGLSEVEVASCGLPRNAPESSCGLFSFATGMSCGTAICYTSGVEGPTSTTDNKVSISFRWGGCNEPSIVTTLLDFFTAVIASVSLFFFSAPFRFLVTVVLRHRSPLFHLSLFTFSSQQVRVAAIGINLLSLCIFVFTLSFIFLCLPFLLNRTYTLYDYNLYRTRTEQGSSTETRQDGQVFALLQWFRLSSIEDDGPDGPL
jgi:hypothetical protein